MLVPISGQNELEQYLIVIFSVAFFPTEFSRGCDLILRHFFCFYGYGACDGTRTLQWTRESCQLITEDLCARDWELLQAFTSNTGLPVCDNLPSSTKDCEGKKYIMYLICREKGQSFLLLNNDISI